MIDYHYRMNFKVRTYEADHRGKATLQSICNYLQETASVHAESLGFGFAHMMRQNVTWVLVRLSVEMERFPSWQEEIIVETWPSDVNGMYAYRDFKIFDIEGKEIGRATTQWAVWHVSRKRVIRPSDIELPPEIHQERQFFPRFRKLEVFNSPDWDVMFRVRQSDLDVNVHVNNVKYIEWALEAIPPDLTNERQIEYFDIIYRNQTFYGERVKSEVKQINESTFRHKITKGDTEVIWAVSVWKRIG